MHQQQQQRATATRDALRSQLNKSLAADAKSPIRRQIEIYSEFQCAYAIVRMGDARSFTFVLNGNCAMIFHFIFFFFSLFVSINWIWRWSDAAIRWRPITLKLFIIANYWERMRERGSGGEEEGDRADKFKLELTKWILFFLRFYQWKSMRELYAHACQRVFALSWQLASSCVGGCLMMNPNTISKLFHTNVAKRVNRRERKGEKWSENGK